jgi:hypothetical protein
MLRYGLAGADCFVDCVCCRCSAIAFHVWTAPIPFSGKIALRVYNSVFQFPKHDGVPRAKRRAARGID